MGPFPPFWLDFYLMPANWKKEELHQLHKCIHSLWSRSWTHYRLHLSVAHSRVYCIICKSLMNCCWWTMWKVIVPILSQIVTWHFGSLLHIEMSLTGGQLDNFQEIYVILGYISIEYLGWKVFDIAVPLIKFLPQSKDKQHICTCSSGLLPQQHQWDNLKTGWTLRVQIVCQKVKIQDVNFLEHPLG